MSRPEAKGPPESFYDEREAKKYTQNSRIMKIQNEMAERALELLALPEDSHPRLLLDLGCGSGLGGAVLSRSGHFWIGMDISEDMLMIARERCSSLNQKSKDENSGDDNNINENFGDSNDDEDNDENFGDSDEEDHADNFIDNDENFSDNDDNFSDNDDTPDQCIGLLHSDMGNGVPFRPGTFDGCISISALQWLVHSNRAYERPKTRLTRLFTTLFACLSRGARAVFQFYPETSSQIDLILACAMKAGFTGGLVIDFPHSTKAKKYYLCLMTGPSIELPKALTINEAKEQIGLEKRTRKRDFRHRKKGIVKHGREWILNKKEAARNRGETVKNDSKYTARRRRIKF